MNVTDITPIGQNEYWVNVYRDYMYNNPHIVGFRHWSKESIEEVSKHLIAKPLYRIHVRLK